MKTRNSIIIALTLVFLVCCNGILFALPPSSNRNSYPLPQDLSKGTDGTEVYLKIPRMTRGNIYTNYWVDNFDDRGSIETSDNLNLSSSELKLELDYENVVLTDDFTTDPLDGTKWDEHVSGGTQISPSPVLMALKLAEAQTEDAYVESDTAWPVERIVEWEWNSVLEGGLTGYNHEFYVFHTATESIWVNIQGDRRVILEQTTVKTTDPVFTISENTWYKMRCKISSTEAVFTIRNMSGGLLNTQRFDHQLTGNGKLKTVFAYNSNTVASFDIRLDNLRISTGYEDAATLTSVAINLPTGKSWDTLGLEKYEPSNTQITISLLNGVNNQPISGYTNINGLSIDLSSLDPVLYSSIKLRAILDGNNKISTPILYHWGLSWAGQNVWQDTFISASKITDSNNVVISESVAKLEEGKTSGTILSEPIYVAETFLWNSVIIEKTELPATSIKFTIIDDYTNNPIEVIDSQASVQTMFAIDPIEHPILRLQATLEGNATATPELYRWSVNWSANSVPEILEFQTQESVLRTIAIQIFIKCSDTETKMNELDVEFEYISPFDSAWGNHYFSDKTFYNNYWVINFTPSKSADLGNYTFKIECTDEYGGTTSETYEKCVRVLNNKPGPPELKIIPEFPNSYNNLNCIASNVTDLEDETITFKYDWYKNNELQPDFVTDVVPTTATSRDEIWKCVVTSYDGNAYGGSSELEVFIDNSPPQIISSIYRVDIQEDTVDSTTLNLFEIFEDPDGDPLKYSKLHDVNISVNIDENNGKVILTPKKDWNGHEIVTFKAYDYESDTDFLVLVAVTPANDPPVIEKINNISVVGRESFTIISEVNKDLYVNIDANDIDGDKLSYSIKLENKTLEDFDNLKFNRFKSQIWFRPSDDDVGVVNINITVSDENGAVDWKHISIKVGEKTKPWYEFDIQSFMILLLMVIFIIVIITSFIVHEWRARKKRKAAEQMQTQPTPEGYQTEEKVMSSVDLLKMLNWRLARNELDLKTYNELKKEIMAMKGEAIKVNVLTSKLIEPDTPPLPIPELEAPQPVPPPPLPSPDLLRLPPHETS